MGISLYAAADGEPISLDEAKAHLRVDLDEEDELVMACIAASRSYLETVCGRSFVSQTWDYTIDNDWPCVDSEPVIELPRAPLVSVTSISYVDSDGATQTLASNQYVVDGSETIGRIYPAYAVIWPTVRTQNRAITVRFVAGYGAAAAVPEAIKQAVLLLVGHFYAQRQPIVLGQSVAEAPMAVDSLIAPYRVYW